MTVAADHYPGSGCPPVRGCPLEPRGRPGIGADHDRHPDHPARHPRRDVRRRHEMAAEHRRHGAGGILRRRLLHARNERQGNPRGLPGQHRPDDHRRHLLLQHGPAKRDHRHHRPDLRAPGQGQDHAAALGVLPHGCRADVTGHLLPRRRRTAGTGGPRTCLRVPHPPGPDGRLRHQRRPRRRLLPAVRRRRAGARHRTEERIPHLPGRALHGQLRPQPHPLRPDHRRCSPSWASCATSTPTSTPASTHPAPAARTASRSSRWR